MGVGACLFYYKRERERRREANLVRHRGQIIPLFLKQKTPMPREQASGLSSPDYLSTLNLPQSSRIKKNKKKFIFLKKPLFPTEKKYSNVTIV